MKFLKKIYEAIDKELDYWEANSAIANPEPAEVNERLINAIAAELDNK